MSEPKRPSDISSVNVAVRCMQGYNATIIAYGQTGSGKTYTMGTGFDMNIDHTYAGIIPRAVQYLFGCIAEIRAKAATRKDPVPEFKVVAQFLELYNEELIDLLDADRSRKNHLRLHENAQGDIYLTGVSTRLVSNLDDTLKCLRDGSLIRSTASTNMNAQSSRSHAIFTLHIRQQRLVKYDDEAGVEAKRPCIDPSSPITEQQEEQDASDAVPEFETLMAKFHFVDLAGSERLKRTGAVGDRAKEGISINRGLLALGNVISALGDKTKRGCHVPYRDSKLTRLLQDSLGGNSRTIMIACISPSDCDFLETLNTLKYANRARNIKNQVSMNQDKTSRQLASLRAQLAALQEEVDRYRQGQCLPALQNDLSNEAAMLRTENDRLTHRVKGQAKLVEDLKLRNCQLLTDLELARMSTESTRCQDNSNDGDDDVATNQPAYMRQFVEKYTIEIEELKTKLAESEALAQFTSHYHHPARTDSPGRVAFSTSSAGLAFPDLGASALASVDAGLVNAADAYFDLNEEGHDVVGANGDAAASLIKRRRRRRRKTVVNQSSKNNALPDNVVNQSTNGHAQQNGTKSTTDNESADEGAVNNDGGTSSSDQDRSNNTTLLADAGAGEDPQDEGDSLSSNESDECCSSDEDSEDGADGQTTASSLRQSAEKATTLHRNLAHVSSALDVKQRLLAQLQVKAAQLDSMRLHYEGQLGELQTRIRETEKERDSVLSNLDQVEHSGEAKLKRTRDEFASKLTSLQDQVRTLQQSRQDQLRLEREQSKKNDELRQLRTEIDDLRRLKVDLTRRLRDETKRTRELEALSSKRAFELKKTKSQADSHIRSLEAAHHAKAKVLQKKEAEIEALKRKTMEQQRLLSTRRTNRLPYTTSSSYRARTPVKATAHVKWTQVERALQAEISRRAKLGRVELDLHNWVKERLALSRQLQRLQLRRARYEEVLGDPVDNDPMFDPDRLRECDQRIRDLTAQLDSVQESINECQTSIIDLERPSVMPPSTTRSGLLSRRLVAPPPQQQSWDHLFTGLTPTDSRFLLQRLFDDAVKRGLEARPTATKLDADGASSCKSNSEHETTTDNSSDEDEPTYRPTPSRCKALNVDDMLGISSSASVSQPLVPTLSINNRRVRFADANGQPPSLLMTGSFTSGVGQLPGAGDDDLDKTNTGVENTSESCPPSPKHRTPSSRLLPASLSQSKLGSSSTSCDVWNRLTSSISLSPKAAKGYIESSQQPTAPSLPSLSVKGSVLPAPPPLTSTGPCQPTPSFRIPMECVYLARGHSNAVLDVDVFDQLMITGSKDRTAKLWDIVSLEEIDTFSDHPNNVSKVRLCPSSNLVFTVCSYFINIWDRRDSRVCIRTLLSSGLSQDGRLETRPARRQIVCPPGETTIMDAVLGSSCSSFDNLALVASANSVRAWDLRVWSSMVKLHANHSAPVMALAAEATTGTESLTVVTGSKDHYMKVFNVSPNSPCILTPRLELEPPHYDGIESLALRDNILFSGSRDAAIKKWNLNRDGRQEVLLAQAHKDWIQALAFVDGHSSHHHQQQLVSGCRAGNLKVWNVDDCSCLGEVVSAHDGPINAIRANKDLVFTAGSDKDVRFWRLIDRES